MRSLGRKGEAYDQIIKHLMSLAKYEKFMDRHYRRLKDKIGCPWMNYDVVQNQAEQSC